MPKWDAYKILIVGAGAQGFVIASELVKYPEIDELKLVDIDLEKARRLMEKARQEPVR